jgi:cytochrome c-type biogenesis protein CcmH
MVFWLVLLVLALMVAATLLAPLWREPARTGGAGTDIAVYRDQLAELDNDLARGTVAPDEADRARTEIARRILAADRAQPPARAAAPPAVSRAVALGLGVALISGAGAIYATLGAPGYENMAQADRIARGDAIRLARPSQSQDEAAAPPLPPVDAPQDYLDMVAQLRRLVPTRPDDVQGWQLLARHEAALGNYQAALAAQDHLVALRAGDASTDDLVMQIDLMVAAAGGLISPEASDKVNALLARDPENLAARYYVGLLYAQTDRPDIAFRMWRGVAETGAPDAVHVQFARAQVEEAAYLAGIDYTLPPLPGQPGPSSADVAAAADLSDADRAAMIRGMVAQLSDRLATQGGTAAEWARLIGAYGVLGDTVQAQAIWTEAQQVFAADPASMTTLRDAATRAGLDP